ncbi:hypothetical protein E0K89_010835 [Aquicoccus sp. SCR17]|nr:hypothetical protein [Carideicomes alvinocaridis]
MRALGITVSAVLALGMAAMAGFVAGVNAGQRQAVAAFCEDESSARYIPDPEILVLVCD